VSSQDFREFSKNSVVAFQFPLKTGNRSSPNAVWRCPLVKLRNTLEARQILAGLAKKRMLDSELVATFPFLARSCLCLEEKLAGSSRRSGASAFTAREALTTRLSGNFYA
jgi:hypothetical protein